MFLTLKTKKYFINIYVSFLENQPYYYYFFLLQLGGWGGVVTTSEDQFWEINPFPTSFFSSLELDLIQKTQEIGTSNLENEGINCPFLSSIESMHPGREMRNARVR